MSSSPESPHLHSIPGAKSRASSTAAFADSYRVLIAVFGYLTQQSNISLELKWPIVSQYNLLSYYIVKSCAHYKPFLHKKER